LKAKKLLDNLSSLPFLLKQLEVN